MATVAKISQKEYLKKYLSNDADDASGAKRKKKKKSKLSTDSSQTAKPLSRPNVRIIDDDIDISRLRPIDDDDLDLTYAIGEEAPQIVGVVDDRPADMIANEDYKESEKWKVLRTVDGTMTVNQLGRDGRTRRRGARLDDDEIQERRRFRKYESDDDDNDDGRTKPKAADRSTDASPSQRPDSRRSASLDVSPRRQRMRSNRSPHKGRSRTSPSADASPPRRRNRPTSSDPSPPRRTQKPLRNVSPDASPPRRKCSRRSRTPDASPPRRKAPANRSPTPDASPPRRKTSRRSRTPERRRQRSQTPDASPPRRKTSRRSRTPESRKQRSQTPDASPPRRKTTRRSHTPDASPPRRQKSRPSADASHSSRQKNDASPTRRHRRPSDSDASPPRRPMNASTSTSKREPARDKLSRWSRDRSADPGSSKMSRTLDGKAAGLQSAQALRKESDGFRKRDAALFEQMSADVSGRHAETIVRDRRTGRVRDEEAEMAVEHEKMRKELERKAVYDRWGKGVKQLEAYQARQAEEQHEASKPLARYADDVDRDELLRDRVRADDPMLEYVRSKQDEQNAGKPARPVYRGAYPENRFGIRPGYRWDGVDRSSGFEKRWFDVQSSSKAAEEETYKYMTEDM